MKKVIITEPGQVSAKDKEKLSKGGYIVIEAKDPSKVRVVSDAEILDGGLVLMAALKGLVEGGYSPSIEKFAKELYRRMAEKESKEVKSFHLPY